MKVKFIKVPENTIREVELGKLYPISEKPPVKVGEAGYTGYAVISNGFWFIADYTYDKYGSGPEFHVDGEYDPDVTHWMLLPVIPEDAR